MDSFLLALSTALWLGILTSISPCPLATNIAAVSYIGRRLDKPSLVIASGALYTFGRTLAYVGLGALLVGGALSVPELSRFLQKYMNQILGPLLILTGMFLLNLISFSTSGSRTGERMQKRVDKMGIWGALPLGVVFALSFCPISAALFFGSLIPLSIEHNSLVMLPLGYGVGTALPVMLLGIVIGVSVGSVGRLFENLTRIEKWARLATGMIFVVVGIYLSLIYIFRVSIL
ncbi:MAG: aromatic aminobenezylarsenical efflux permease ArsG family transporter [Candidatus Zixiibacteriota bacterium]